METASFWRAAAAARQKIQWTARRERGNGGAAGVSKRATRPEEND